MSAPKQRKGDEVAPNAGVPHGDAAAVWLPLDALAPHPKNPRVHGDEVTALARTILRTAWGAPIVAQWRASGRHRVIAGHGRLLAAREILRGVEVDGEMRGGGEHLFDPDAPGPALLPVRVVRVSDAEADAMTLADNARAIQGADDAALIVEMAAQFGRDASVMADIGFDGAALDALVKSAGDVLLAGGGGDTERPDAIGDPPQGEDAGAEELPPDAPVVSRAGEVYELGPHRLVCGDSRDAATWAKLMGGTKANVVFTSPPYASQRKYDESSGFKPVPPDDYVAWWEPLQACVRAHLAADGSFFVNIKEHCDDGQRHLYVKDLTIAHVRAWGWRFVDEFCWAHRGLPGSWPNRLKNAWEPVFHYCAAAQIKFRPKSVGSESDQCFHEGGRVSGTNRSGNVGWHGGDVERVTDVALPGNVIDLPNNPANHDGASHSAAFPLGLPEFFIKAFSDAGDLVVDPFLGSGTTLIAAAKTGRVARGLEISPRYCDVIRRRWTKYARSAGVDPGAGALD